MEEDSVSSQLSKKDQQRWGELSTAQTLKDLQTIIESTLLETIDQTMSESLASLLEISQVNLQKTVQSLSERVLALFPFQYQGSGVGTIPRQLEHYRKYQAQQVVAAELQTQADLKKGLDCKFPTVMLGLAIKLLAKNDSNLGVSLLVRNKSAHPILLIESANHQPILVDFHLHQVGDGAIQTNSYQQDLAQYRHNTVAVAQSQPVKREKLQSVLARGRMTRLELDPQGLRSLDQLFIES